MARLPNAVPRPLFFATSWATPSAPWPPTPPGAPPPPPHSRRPPAVLSISEAAYEERILPAGTLDPDRLAVLSDALEEAGCDNPDILSHLRGPGPHVRGCWVLDLLLEKE